ncbi:MAG: hypothetical protein HFJ75_05025 [Eggerthellaceae bacterium]|nr:hypothetical protein [Eggerthellaceae bacterium]
MKKPTMRVACLGILAIIYAAYALLISLLAPQTATSWIALLFGLAQGVLLYFAGISRTQADVSGLFQTYPKLVLPTLFLLIQLAVGGALALLLPGDTTISIVTGVILLAMSSIALIGAEKGMSYASQVENAAERSTAFSRDLLMSLRGIEADFEVRGEEQKALNELIDTARFSNSRSLESTSEIESQINAYVEQVKESGRVDLETLQSISRLLDKRNIMIKAGKK